MVGVRVEVEVREVLDEHRRTLEQCAVGVDDEAAAVEDEVVLAADLVDVDHRRVDLARATRAQVEPRVRLALLVRRAVDGQQQVDAHVSEFGDGAAVLPDVLADSDADARAVDVEHDGALAGREDAELVEDAVVGQEVLVVAGPDVSAVQHDEAVARLAVGVVGADRADDDVQAAHAFVAECGGEPVGRVPCGRPEGRAQREVLDRIAGERHLREDDDVGAALHGAAREIEDLAGVAVKVADAGVDLRECET